MAKRSTKSVRSESSEIDIDASDITKLQRQFQTMERDQKAYDSQAREQIRKQEHEIKKLLQEQEELRKNLRQYRGVRDDDARDDVRNTRRIQVLLEQSDQIDKEIETKKQCQKQLQAEISSLEVELAKLRKGKISDSSNTLRVQKTLKTIHTVENKLHRASVCLNEQLSKKSHVKEELQTLLTEKARFQQLHKRLNKELLDVNKKIRENLEQSIAAHEARKEIKSKMYEMQEKAVKELLNDKYHHQLSTGLTAMDLDQN